MGQSEWIENRNWQSCDAPMPSKSWRSRELSMSRRTTPRFVRQPGV